jgi:hypothetical protein
MSILPYLTSNPLDLFLSFFDMDTFDNLIFSLLLFGFIQMLHLTTKMCVPRRAKANRPFSTSWGRSAYICSSRQMEMTVMLEKLHLGANIQY